MTAATPPLLVTGLPRSGTSWAGKMIEASGSVTYVNEPLNPKDAGGRSPGVLLHSPEHQFQYICADNDAPWYPAFTRTVGLRFNVGAELRRNHGAGDLARAANNASRFTLGRLRGRHALLKDPFALFSTRWLVERIGVRALVIVRDPVAMIGSYINLGWTYRPEALRSQPLLVRDLNPKPDELLALAGSEDRVAKLAHLWRVGAFYVDSIRHLPGVEVRHYEDLVRDPIGMFTEIYQFFGLPFTAEARERINAATNAAGNSDKGFAWSLKGGLSRTAYKPMSQDAALRAHTSSVTAEDKQRVREITADAVELLGRTR